MKEPSALELFMSANTPISLEELIDCGHSLTVDQFLEAKKEFDEDDNLRENLIKECETRVV